MQDVPTLILIFSGLIAFVPMVGEVPPSMTALLLPEDGHRQVLRVTMGSLRCFEGRQCPPECRIVKDEDVCARYCECPLNRGATVTLGPLLDSVQPVLPDRPEGILPTLSNAYDLSWLVRLKNIDKHFAKVDPDKITGATKLTFQWTNAATCAFDEEVDARERTIFGAKFIQLGRVVHQQAVAEMVVFETPMANQNVVIHISDPHITLLLLCTDRFSCPVDLQNRPTPTHQKRCNGCGECIWGEHFGEYWKLTGKSSGGGGIPRRECGSSRVLDLPNNEHNKLCPIYPPVKPECRPLAEPQCGKLFGDKEEVGLLDVLRPKRTAAEKLLLSTALFIVGERPICPMVLLEP